MWERGYTRAEATREAEQRWTDHVAKMYEIMLMRKAKSWFTGYNSNVAGHEEGTVRYFVYNGGAPKYVGIINDVAARGIIRKSRSLRCRAPACKRWLDAREITPANVRHGHAEAAKPARLADGRRALDADAARLPEGDLRAPGRLPASRCGGQPPS